MVLGVSYLGGIADGIATGRVRGRGVNDEPDSWTSGRNAQNEPPQLQRPTGQKTESETWMAGSVYGWSIGALTPACRMVLRTTTCSETENCEITLVTAHQPHRTTGLPSRPSRFPNLGLDRPGVILARFVDQAIRRRAQAADESVGIVQPHSLERIGRVDSKARRVGRDLERRLTQRDRVLGSTW